MTYRMALYKLYRKIFCSLQLASAALPVYCSRPYQITWVYDATYTYVLAVTDESVAVFS